MIDKNTLKFGYGDIAVGSDLIGRITFQQFKPSVTCGDNVPDEAEATSEKISITITYDNYLELIKLLNNIGNMKLNAFDFENYVFDFTNYNIKSVETVMKHLKKCNKWILYMLGGIVHNGIEPSCLTMEVEK